MFKPTISLTATYISGFELELTIVKSFVTNIRNGFQVHHYPSPLESAIMDSRRNSYPPGAITKDKAWRRTRNHPVYSKVRL